jgi:O-antigen ligase
MYVLLAVTSVSLLVAPFASLDPVNLPKLCLLILLAFVAAGLVFSKKRFLFSKLYRMPVIAIGLFILQLCLVFLFDDRTFALKFYGTASRNTGFIAYLSLSFLLLAAIASASYLLIARYVWALMVVGTILGLYGVAQSKGYDFYEFDNAYASNVFGSFGNQNFQSAFMGITASVAVSLIVFSKLKNYLRLILLAISLLAIYNISLSSQQGYLNLIAGIAAAAIVYFFMTKHSIFGWTLLGLTAAGSFFVLLGLLNAGPLAQLLYKSSLQAREFYWRAAFRMMLENPFLGVGMDGFGDWFRRTRPSDYSARGFLTVSDTAHNIPLDIGSSGGFPLLTLYLAIIALAFFAIVKVIKRKGEFDVFFAAIVAAWVAYQAQSLISINQLGLGVWGWSLTGLLIGYEINTRDISSKENVKSIPKGKRIAEKLSAGAILVTFITGSIGLAISIPPYLAADRFYKSLKSGDANVIQPAAYVQPYDRSRFVYVARILKENKLEDRAIIVLRDASKIYPDSYEIWNIWVGITSASPNDVDRAKAEMKRLDPFNPDLK